MKRVEMRFLLHNPDGWLESKFDEVNENLLGIEGWIDCYLMDKKCGLCRGKFNNLLHQTKVTKSELAKAFRLYKVYVWVLMKTRKGRDREEFLRGRIFETYLKSQKLAHHPKLGVYLKEKSDDQDN